MMLTILRTFLLVLVLTGVSHAENEASKPPSKSTRSWSQFLQDVETGRSEALRYRHPSLLNAPGLQALYRVRDDLVLEIEEGTIFQKHLEIWNDLRMLSKEPLHTVLTSFAVYEHATLNKNSPIGFVVTTVEGKFGLAIDVNRRFHEPYLHRILLHEYGHILFPVSPQLRLIVNGCITNATPRGNEFVIAYQRAFWAMCNDAVVTLPGLTHVSIYAGEDIAEDLAETWVSFILCSNPAENDLRLATMKRRMMWSDTTLVDRRAYIYESFGTDRLDKVRQSFPYYCR